MKRVIAAALAAAVSSTAFAATDPRTLPTKLAPAWQAKTRELFKQVIEIPTVHNRGEVPRMAKLLADRFRAAGIPDADIHIMPYEALPGDQTAALIVRWRAPHATKKPMLILGHMDVVEAKREDWKFDPFVFREQDGYFLGRGTSDMKNGDVATTMAAVKLMSEGFKPSRDIIFFYSGDEETRGVGATLGSTKWRNLTEAEFGLNADGGCATYDEKCRPIGCEISIAEKTFQTYLLTTRNPGGHSSRPRPDNAIYELADALARLARFTFPVELNPTSRAFFEQTAKVEQPQTAAAMRAIAANTRDSTAAATLSRDPRYASMLRTTCVATRLAGGHAYNALPQTATANVNCRMAPTSSVEVVRATLARVIADTGIKISFATGQRPDFPASVPPIEPAVLTVTTELTKKMWGDIPVVPTMSTGATDGHYLRAAGIPTYGVSGLFSLPGETNAHGRDEKLRVKSFYEGLDFLDQLVRRLGSGVQP